MSQAITCLPKGTIVKVSGRYLSLLDNTWVCVAKKPKRNKIIRIFSFTFNVPEKGHSENG
jgi:hypothetical protein